MWYQPYAHTILGILEWRSSDLDLLLRNCPIHGSKSFMQMLLSLLPGHKSKGIIKRKIAAVEDNLEYGEGEEVEEEFEEMKQKDENGEEEEENNKEYYDPPLPNIAVDAERLEKRSEMAEKGTDIIIESALDEVKKSLQNVQQIPTSDGIDRVVVTDNVSEWIDRSKTRDGINKAIENNVMAIQKALSLRKSGLLIMNKNYNRKLVRRPEPIDLVESRTLITHDPKKRAKI